MSISDDSKNEHLKLNPASIVSATRDISVVQEIERQSIEMISEVKESDPVHHVFIDSLESIQNNPTLPVLSTLKVTDIDRSYLQKIKTEIREGHYDTDEGLERILKHVLSSTLSTPRHFVDQMMPQFKALVSLYPELKDQILLQLVND